MGGPCTTSVRFPKEKHGFVPCICENSENYRAIWTTRIAPWGAFPLENAHLGDLAPSWATLVVQIIVQIAIQTEVALVLVLQNSVLLSQRSLLDASEVTSGASKVRSDASELSSDTPEHRSDAS